MYANLHLFWFQKLSHICSTCSYISFNPPITFHTAKFSENVKQFKITTLWTLYGFHVLSHESVWHEHLQWWSQFTVAQVVHLSFMFIQPQIFVKTSCTYLTVLIPFKFIIILCLKAGSTYKSSHYHIYPLSEQSSSAPQFIHLKWHGDNSSIKSKHFIQIFLSVITNI